MGGGPYNPDDCYQWFKKRWDEQYKWVTDSMSKTTADWQIAVTHYPASFSVGPTEAHIFWPSFAAQYGIDIVIAGHVHLQEVNYKVGGTTSIGRVTGVDMGDVAWVVPGGFMDMEISLETIKIT